MKELDYLLGMAQSARLRDSRIRKVELGKCDWLSISMVAKMVFQIIVRIFVVRRTT